MAPTPPPTGKMGLPVMAEQTPTKPISSRLMTMKFMQRAAASEASSPPTPTTEEHSGKRRKVSHTSATASPSNPLFDMRAAKAAMEEEEKKREAAVARLAQQLGDSHWVLDGQIPGSKHAVRKPLKVVQIGFAQIDSPDTLDETAGTPGQGKRSFGVKKEPDTKQSKKRKADGSDSDGATSDSDAETSDDPKHDHEQGDRGRRMSIKDGSSRRSQSSFSRKRNEERKKSQQFAGRRRKKDVNLNKPMSISSAGAGARFSR